MKFGKFLLTTAFTSIAIVTHAGDWSGEGDLGYNSVSGNSESDSLALGLLTAYETTDWKHTGEFDAYTASQDNETNAQSYTLVLQSDRNINETTYGFGKLRYLDDRFSGYDYQASLTFGLGKTFIEDGNNLFTGQIGLGYRQSELRDNLGSEDEPVGTGQITYNRDLTDTTVFQSTWIAETGSDNTYLEGTVAVIVAISDALGLKVSYQAKHNTDVPAGTEKTDKYTTISLNYKFM